MSSPDIAFFQLTAGHDLSAFSSDSAPLDEYLKKHALNAIAAGSARVYVALVAGQIVGYFTLSMAEIVFAPELGRIAKGMPRHPIPVVKIGRFAVDTRWQQGKGVGPAMLKEALTLAFHGAQNIGARAVVVHAKDARSKGFYEHFHFEELPGQPFTLTILMKDLKAVVS